MKTREKLILSGTIILLGSIFNLFFSAALHGVLSRQYSTITLIPLWDCISGLFTSRQHLLLFLSFEGFICLCCVLFFVQNNRPYQSELIKVSGDISTPAPVGQFQHGSSRWLRGDEMDKVFHTMTIDPTDPLIQKLLDSGYDNLPFLEKDRQIPSAEIRQEDTPPCATHVEQETVVTLPVSIKKKS